jgi:TRAP-type uncharacterized transport system substrate-binding protein
MKQFGAFVAITLLTLAMVAPSIFAQSQSLIVATGVRDGTYARFFSDISKTCPRPPLRGVASQGSLENLERVMNNKANLAFVQADVLFAKKLIEHDPGVEVIRAYLVLYLEEIHILIESSNTTITKFSDLANKRIGVYGGSVITALILFGGTGIQPAKTQTFAGPFEAVHALGKDLDAVLGIGGKPLPWVEALDAKYKLVPFDQYEKVSKVYFPAILNYSNLDQPGGIRTIAVPSMLITRNYTMSSMVTPLVQLRSCIVQNLKVLRETTGYHPKWSEVNPENKINWPYLEAANP